MARRKPKEYDDDDGRVICDMDPVSNIDLTGKVWPNRDDRHEAKEETNTQISTGPQLTRSEARRFTLNAMLAGLVVALVFSAVWVLFTLFATQVWLR
jgi:hypothetical protein